MALDADDLQAASSSGATPFATIQAAIDFADSHPTAARKVCVAGGDFAAPLRMRNGIGVYGAFDGATWSRDTGGSTPLTTLSTLDGILFGDDVVSPTVLDGFRVELEAPGEVALLTDSAAGVELSSLEITCDTGGESSSCVVISGGSVNARQVRVEVRALHTAVGLSATDAELTLSSATVSVRVQQSIDADIVPRGEAKGLHIQRPRDVVLDEVSVGASDSVELNQQPSGSGSWLAGVQVSGPGDIVLNGTVSVHGLRSATVIGIAAEGLDTFSMSGAVTALADGPPSMPGQPGVPGNDAEATGISAQAAAVDIGADVWAATWDGYATGITCGTHCTIHDSTVRAGNASFTPRMPAVSTALSCQGTVCAVQDSTIGGAGGTTCYYGSLGVFCESESTGARVRVTEGGLVARNFISGGSALRSVGLDVSGAVRIENNVVTSSNVGWMTDRSIYGIIMDGPADLHSNTISVSLNAPFFNKQAGCSTAPVFVKGGSASVRNNVLSIGGTFDYCGGGNHFAEGCADCTPLAFQNNAFSYDAFRVSLVPGLLYGNFGTPVTTIAEINALGDMQSGANFASLLDCAYPIDSGSSCRDAGTVVGVPSEDLDGEIRDESPDVGADEWHPLCAACANGTCRQYGRTEYCSCDAGYQNAAGAPIDCGTDYECRTNPALFECVDIDECATDNGGCDPLSTCTNLPGSRSCGPCPDGYEGTGETECLPPPEPFIDLAGSCALEQSGHVYCWGAARRNPPLQGKSFIEISGGLGDVCGREADGSVTCTTTQAPAGEFLDVSAGNFQSCGRRPNRTIECWGTGAGVSDVPAGEFDAVAAGYMHVCALRSDGSVVCWGGNQFQQLVPPIEPFAKLCAGNIQSCGLRGDGSIACWGDVSWLAWSSPPTGSFDAIYCGNTFACAMDAAGELKCWGQEAARVPPSGSFVDVSLGHSFGCALTEEGSAVCWGADNDGDTRPPGS